ncbi:hypothetical protein PALS1_106 [Staphylococcus phage PALS_1]|nr:hypothetical protein PALS1_106 [Staphylococcus phage PALS_1]
MLNEKLKNLEDTKVYMINSIASLLSASTGKSSKVFFDEGDIKIVNGDIKAVEIIDGLVHPHSGRLPIKTTERIALGKLTDSLQFVISEVEVVKDQIIDKENEDYIDFVMGDWNWD